MDAVTFGAVLLALVSGAAGSMGDQLWKDFTALIRRPFRHRQVPEGRPAGAPGTTELTALEQVPTDRGRATALAEALLARADADPEFSQALGNWWQRASSVSNSIGGSFYASISGGTFYGSVMQAQTINQTFNLTTHALPPVALDQLPAPVAGFTGRDNELALLTELLGPGDVPMPVVVSAIAGLAGAGKTALAVQAGHASREKGWFRGGFLFIDLHGYDEKPTGAGQALDALLRALGVPAEYIPAGAEERAGLYRSTLAKMKNAVLIIADNASAEDQIRPLLPGTRPHKLVVTSRHTLAGLGARLLDIAVLDENAAISLLDSALRIARPGDERIAVERDAARRLAGLCGGLPLALQILAALLKADSELSVHELVGQLAIESARLDRLAYDDGSIGGGASVAASFGLSYRHLDDAAARMFRLLSVNPGPDVSTVAAATLADTSVERAREILGGLAKAHLVEAAPGTPGHWRMHDLLRLYARRLSDQHVGADGREQACDRLLAYYLETADAADGHLRALPGIPVSETFTGREDALAWFDAERPSLVAAVDMAADTGRDKIAWDLPVKLAVYLQWRRRFDDLLSTAATSLGAARRIADQQGVGLALERLGLALWESERLDEAITELRAAAAICWEAGSLKGHCIALTNLGGALNQAQRFDEAITTLQDAAAAWRELGDRVGESRALGNLAIALKDTGRYAEAVTANQDVLTICRESGDRHGEAPALANLGVILALTNRLDEALVVGQEAVVVMRETADRNGEGAALENLGTNLRTAGRFDEALAALQEALAAYRETDDQKGQGDVQTMLGMTLSDMSRLEEAVTALEAAIVIYRETGDRDAESAARESLRTAQVAQNYRNQR